VDYAAARGAVHSRETAGVKLGGDFRRFHAETSVTFVIELRARAVKILLAGLHTLSANACWMWRSARPALIVCAVDGWETQMPDEEGHFIARMDGEWDLDDLQSLTSSVRLSYAYFYWISQDPGAIDSAVRSGLARYFWTGERVGDRFAQTLYERIPEKRRLKLSSIHFASPGWIDLLGYLPVLMVLGYVARLWIRNFDQAFDLFKKVDQYFADRKLRDLRAKGSIEDIDGQFVDEARALCFKYGNHLGFSDDRVKAIIDLTDNPIAALRLLVAVSSEARRLHNLEQQGKIALPEVKSESRSNGS
jgi:hypothetical protein